MSQVTMYDRSDIGGYTVGHAHPTHRELPRFALRHVNSGDIQYVRDAECVNDVLCWPDRYTEHEGPHEVIDLTLGYSVAEIWI